MVQFSLKDQRPDIDLWLTMSSELDKIWEHGCMSWVARHKPDRLRIINDLESRFSSIVDNKKIELDGSSEDQELRRIISSLKSAYITALNVYRREKK